MIWSPMEVEDLYELKAIPYILGKAASNLNVK